MVVTPLVCLLVERSIIHGLTTMATMHILRNGALNDIYFGTF